MSQKGEPLREAEWIVLSARGFGTEAAAQEFGEQLRQVVELAALCARLGVDVGQDRSTTWMAQDFALSLGLIQPYERCMPNVHGLMVLPDDGLSRFPIMDVQATATADPAQLVSSLSELGRQMPLRVAAAAAGVRVLNLALIAPGPLAQVVLALSAVEELGQDETWSERQRALLDELADQVAGGADGDAERQEVVEALRRNLHRIGLRQGVMRVLARLELNHLRKEWDRLYGLRSGVFHGTARLTEPELNELAQAAITLCARVVLAVVEREGLRVPAVAETHFPR